MKEKTIKIPISLLKKRASLTKTSILLHDHLLKVLNSDGYGFFTYNLLCNDLNVCLNSIKDSLLQLKKAGLILTYFTDNKNSFAKGIIIFINNDKNRELLNKPQILSLNWQKMTLKIQKGAN